MNEPQPTPEQKPAPRRSWLRRIFIFLLLMSGAVAAFYAFENWRGNRAWKEYEQAAKAKGVPLDWRTDWPKRRIASPDSDLTKEAAASGYSKTFDLAIQLAVIDSPTAEHYFEDLVAWEQALAALKSDKTPEALKQELKINRGNTNAADRARAGAVVAQALNEGNSFYSKLRSACHRPGLIYPFCESSGSLSNILPVIPRVFEAINIARVLRVKAAAELAAGNSAAALGDLDLVLCLAESLRTDPPLISGIGSLACFRISLRVPWEGLADKRFTDSDLRQLQEILGADDFIVAARRVFEGERASFLPIFDQLIGNPKDGELFRAIPSSPVEGVLLSAIPSGWIRLEQLNYAVFYDRMLSAGFPESGKRAIDLRGLGTAWEQIQARLSAGIAARVLDHTLITSTLMPKLTEFMVNSAASQVIRDQTKLACGLERYYLKNANYPEKLEAIVPEFLPAMPADPITGEPYHYTRQVNGRYKIWSVGSDAKDDGGTPGKTGRYEGDGDWVWQYP